MTLHVPAWLGAALEQNIPEGWKPMAFASRFVNSTEERYSVNELELLGIVWSIDYIKYYLYGKIFTVITDNRALLSILKEHRSNKSYNSRLSRWIDQLLPYNFTIEHMPEAKMGLVDYISINPFARARKVSTYDEHFVVATLSKICDSMEHLIRNKQNTIQKLNSILKLHLPSYHSNQLIAPELPTSLNDNSQFNTKPVASQSLHCRKLLPFAPQLTLSNSTVNPYLITLFASQMTSKIANSQFVPNNLTANNSHSINKFIPKALQMSDKKECEQFEQVYPIEPKIGIKSSNQHKYVKLSANVKIPEYKYSPQKQNSLLAKTHSE